LLPEVLDDYVAEDNAVLGIDVFVDELDSRRWGLWAWSGRQRTFGLPSCYDAKYLL
jgi:hypothetical protein